MTVELKRAYDRSEKSDGCRVLVDRVWPRGVSKDTAKIDWWAKSLAPSTELRKWYGHDPGKWPEFKRRYFRELEGARDELDHLMRLAKRGRVTLVFGAKDAEHSNAAALQEYLRKRLRQ